MREVVRDDPEVARMRSWVQGKPEAATYYDRIRLGVEWSPVTITTSGRRAQLT